MRNYFGIFVLFGVFGASLSLECYTCNVSTSTLDQDGCRGIGTLNKCSGSSVCLGAVYEVKTDIVKTYKIMQSCFPDLAGQECNSFAKTQKDLHRSAEISLDYCYVCSSDICNKNPKNPSHGSVFRASIALILSIISVVLII